MNVPGHYSLPSKACGTSSFVAVTCSCRRSRRVDGREPQRPRNGECAGCRETGTRGWLELAEAGPNLPEVIPESADRSLLGPRSPPARSVEVLLAAAGSRDLRAVCPVTARGRVAPRLCSDRGKGQRDSRDSVSRVRAWEELWCGGSPVPPFTPGNSFSFHFSRCLGSRASNPRSCLLSLPLSRAGSKSLNFQIFPRVSRRHLLSSS